MQHLTNTHTSNNSNVDLTQFDDEFRSAGAEAPTADFEEVPDGSYQVSVEKVELTTSSTGKPMLKWGLRIIAPHHVNRLLWRNNVFTANTIPYIKADLQTCGLDLPTLSALHARLHSLLDVRLEVTKKTKGEYANIYFNRRIEGGARPDHGGIRVAF